MPRPHPWTAAGLLLLVLGSCTAAPAPASPASRALEAHSWPVPTPIASELSAGRLGGFDLNAYSRLASAIVHGRVAAAESSFATFANGDELIVTVAELEVQETFGGEADETVTISFIGGSVGDVTLRVGHGVALAPEEEVVLFLARGPTQTRVLGGSAGKLVVQEGMVGNTGLELGDFHDAVFVARREASADRERANGREEPGEER